MYGCFGSPLKASRKTKNPTDFYEKPPTFHNSPQIFYCSHRRKLFEANRKNSEANCPDFEASKSTVFVRKTDKKRPGRSVVLSRPFMAQSYKNFLKSPNPVVLLRRRILTFRPILAVILTNKTYMAVRSASLAAFIFPKELAKFCAVGKRFCLKSLVKERYFVILHFYLYTLEQVGACLPSFSAGWRWESAFR